MGKLIAKTAALTLACILAVLLVLFGVFSLFFPGVMVSLTDSLGLEGPCATYSISLYNRTGKADDLADALERSYAAEHYGDVAEYGKVFIFGVIVGTFSSIYIASPIFYWWHRGDRQKVEEGEKAYTYSWDAGTEKK